MTSMRRSGVVIVSGACIRSTALKREMPREGSSKVSSRNGASSGKKYEPPLTRRSTIHVYFVLFVGSAITYGSPAAVTSAEAAQFHVSQGVTSHWYEVGAPFAGSADMDVETS